MKENFLDLKLIQKKLICYCIYQERSIFEVKERLKKYALSQIQRQLILDWLSKNDFLNEKRFVESFIRSKLFYKGWGIKKISFMLKLKNIDEDLIQKALKEISLFEYKKKLKSLIEKKNQTKKLNKEELVKTINFFKNKGFEEDLIREML